MANKVGIFKGGKGLYGGSNTQAGQDDVFIMDGGGHSSSSEGTSGLVTGIVSGNGVAWVEGYKYEVTPYVFNINNKQYTTQRQTVTLEAADPTYDRIDLIVATYNAQGKGAIEVVTGSPAQNPAEPSTTVYQIKITAITVQGGADSASPDLIVVYDENAEFAGTDNTAGSIDYANADNPFNGTKAIKITDFVDGDEIYLSGSDFNPSEFTVLQMLISSEAKWTLNGDIEVALFNGLDRVSDWVKIDGDPYNSKGNEVFFQSGNPAYQTVVVPMFKLIPTSSVANKLVIRKTSLGQDTFYIDLIRFQKGIDFSTTVTESAVYVEPGQFVVYTRPGNANVKTLQVNDLVSGWFSPTRFFTLAKYLGGSLDEMASFDVINEELNP